MKYDETQIDKLCCENLSAARTLLASLPVAQGRQPSTKALNGWVYEQTIRYCLCEDLKESGVVPAIQEQVSLCGRAKVDFLVGAVAIEVKALGVFSKESPKTYGKYRAAAETKGWTYLYLTRGETYVPYRLAMQSVFGDARAFFLDTPGDWERFIEEILTNY